MTLAARLDAIRKSFADKATPEAKAVMTRAAEELRSSDVGAGVLSTGSRAPDFTLPDSTGKSVSRADLTGRSGLVVTFFRGHW